MGKAEQIVDAILADATDRRGWRQEWDQFDEDIRAEIRQTWTDLVRSILETK